MTDATRPVTGVDGMPHEDFEWGSIAWLMNGAICADAQQTFGVVYINPGMTNSLHSHPNCEELLYVVSGRCQHTLGDQAYALGAGDMIRIPAGTPHNATNTGWAPVVMVISYPCPDRQTRGRAADDDEAGPQPNQLDCN